MTRLLVSVRSAAEAEIALAGGAGLIDVKEPANGPLGMAPVSVIREVINAVAGRVPVSAALGEARDAGDFLADDVAVRLAFVKYGTAGCRGVDMAQWERTFSLASRRLQELHAACRVAAVAYADWNRARSPAPGELCDLACQRRAGAFLLDTWEKDGSTLLDWLPPAEIEGLARRCRSAGIPIALAGSLGPPQIRELAPLRPDWIAVRGAACRSGRRESTIDLAKVRGLAQMLSPTTHYSPLTIGPVPQIDDAHLQAG
jgi:uncharacterized protein (UPF0264 family)